MAPASSGKVCIVCGTDCAKTPRVKDPRGRYFCKPCYEEALNRKKTSASHDSRHDGADESRAPTPRWGSSLLDDAPEGAGACPECGSALDEGAVLCVNCGYVLRAGKHITPEVIVDEDDEPDAPPAQVEAPGRTKWPIVLGVFSLIFAVFGAIQYGLMALAAVGTNPADAGGPVFWALGIVAHVVLLALAIGLGVCAVALLQRRAFASEWLPRWAWTKLGVSIVYAIIVGAALAAAAVPELEAVGAIIVAIVVPILLLWLIFWPVLILLWMRREGIREEVAAWK